jgi:hypothetical protein
MFMPGSGQCYKVRDYRPLAHDGSPDMVRHAVLLIAPMLLAMLAGGPAPSRADDACIEDWSKAALIVKAQGLATVETVTKLAAARIAGDVVKVTLCRDGDRYVYRLVVRSASGRHSSLPVDAIAPFSR